MDSAGDVIYVPRVEQRIAVFGQVRTPGSYVLPLGQKVTVLERRTMPTTL